MRAMGGADSGSSAPWPEALEIAHHAPAQRGRKFADLLVLERRCAVESWRELSWHAAVGAVEEQSVAGI